MAKCDEHARFANSETTKVQSRRLEPNEKRQPLHPAILDQEAQPCWYATFARHFNSLPVLADILDRTLPKYSIATEE